MEALLPANLPVWTVAKIFVLFGLLIYMVFGVVIVRQTNLMTDTLELGQERIIRAFSTIHFILIVVVFILALLIL